MAKFKKGDRVKVVCSMAEGVCNTTVGAGGRHSMYAVGNIGTVLRKEGPDYRVQMDDECRMPGGRYDLLVDHREIALLVRHPVEMMLS